MVRRWGTPPPHSNSSIGLTQIRAECILASQIMLLFAENAQCVPTQVLLMQWFTCGPSWLMGRDKDTGLEVMPFREGTGRNYPVWVCSVYRCTGQNRGWTPRRTHCSLKYVGGRQQPHCCEQLASAQPEGSQAQSLSGVWRTPLGWLETTNPKS